MRENIPYYSVASLNMDVEDEEECALRIANWRTSEAMISLFKSAPKWSDYDSSAYGTKQAKKFYGYSSSGNGGSNLQYLGIYNYNYTSQDYYLEVLETPIEEWILIQDHEEMYQVRNIKKNPNEEIWYDIWILMVKKLGVREARFFNSGENEDPNNLSPKCCMENVNGHFYYGAYAQDYNYNVIARRVIEYSFTDGF